MKRKYCQTHSQAGVALIAALLFLLLLTSAAVVSVNQMTLSPRMLANAELKTLTFNAAQKELAITSDLDDGQFHINECANEKDPYNPALPPPTLNNTQKAAFPCIIGATTTTARFLAEGKPVHRKETASGYNREIADYYRLRAHQVEAGIGSTLIEDRYKLLIQADSTGDHYRRSSDSIRVTVGSNSN